MKPTHNTPLAPKQTEKTADDILDEMIKMAVHLIRRGLWKNIIEGVTFYIIYDPHQDSVRPRSSFGPLIRPLPTNTVGFHFYKTRCRRDARDTKAKEFLAGIRRAPYVVQIDRARSLVNAQATEGAFHP
jgi:hypothetical protein